MTASVYYLRDTNDGLLYVGFTEQHPFARAKQHASKPWFDEVRSITFVSFSTAIDAARYEIEEIQKHKPKHNVAMSLADYMGQLRPTGLGPRHAERFLHYWHGSRRRAEAITLIGLTVAGHEVNEGWCQKAAFDLTGSARRHPDNRGVVPKGTKRRKT